MKLRPILQHLDSPVRILSFSIQDVIGYLAPFFVGALFDSLFFIPITGLFVVYVIKRLLRQFPKFYLVRHLYWIFPTARFNKILRLHFPPSSKRFWVK